MPNRSRAPLGITIWPFVPTLTVLANFPSAGGRPCTSISLSMSHTFPTSITIDPGAGGDGHDEFGSVGRANVFGRFYADRLRPRGTAPGMKRSTGTQSVCIEPSEHVCPKL